MKNSVSYSMINFILLAFWLFRIVIWSFLPNTGATLWLLLDSALLPIGGIAMGTLLILGHYHPAHRSSLALSHLLAWALPLPQFFILAAFLWPLL